MKHKLLLILLLITLWGFLLLYNYCVPLLPVFKIGFITIDMPQLPAFALLIGFIFAYTALINIAYKQKRILNKKNPSSENTDYHPFISIVVPCHCEANVIGDTIENLMSIEYPSYELIVIDDRSTDNTAVVLKEYEDKYNGKMRSMIRPQDAYPGKSAVLNEVFELTKGEVICVFDADARIKPDFLSKILPYLAPKDVGAVQARKIISNRDYNFLTRCQDNELALDSHFQCGRDAIKGAVELRGNGQLIKKEALLSINKWNNDSITDDLDLSTKLHLKGWDVRFCIDLEVYEEGVLTFSALIKQRRRWIEGSIRRYLDYFDEMITSQKISLWARLDMLAYIAEFLLPIWFAAEIVLQSAKIIDHQPNNVMSSVLLMASMGIIFFTGLVYALCRYKKLSYRETLKQSLETTVYLILFWTPLVVLIIPKIIFTKRSMDWGKTDHGVILKKTKEFEKSKV